MVRLRGLLFGLMIAAAHSELDLPVVIEGPMRRRTVAMMLHKEEL
jgi:hypothetical protein